jgi:hypothetical protein
MEYYKGKFRDGIVIDMLKKDFEEFAAHKNTSLK